MRVARETLEGNLRGVLALLTPEERAAIDAAMERLRLVVGDSREPAAIEAAIKQLENDCEFYVERRMNSNIRKAMAGHRVDEFSEEDGRGAE